VVGQWGEAWRVCRLILSLSNTPMPAHWPFDTSSTQPTQPTWAHAFCQLTSKRLTCVFSNSSLVSSSRILASCRLTRDLSTMDCSWNSSWLCRDVSCQTHTYRVRIHTYIEKNKSNMYSILLNS